jgi:hypothetical protein
VAIDATIAGASANAYLTVADADALNGDRNGRQATIWSAATNEQKENALIEATFLLDAISRVSAPYSTVQALSFPRAVDVDTALDPFLPSRLRTATYEQASYLLANQKLLDDAASRRARQLFTFDEDGISGSISADPLLGLIAPKAQMLLSSMAATAGGDRVGSIQLRSKLWQPNRTTI